MNKNTNNKQMNQENYHPHKEAVIINLILKYHFKSIKLTKNF